MKPDMVMGGVEVHGEVHKGKVTVVLNKAELNARAYRGFLDKVRPLLDKYASGGHKWNFGYGDSGVWTYPGFSTFQDFDSEKKQVSFVFFSSYDSHGSRGEPVDDFMSNLHTSDVFDKFLRFAKEVANVTGYTIVVQKPYWLQLRQEELERIRRF